MEQQKDDRLGKQGEDKITGFKGTIIGAIQYLTGCTQLGLTPRIDKDGKVPGSEWFDEGRIIVTQENTITADSVKSRENGGPNRDFPG